MKYLYDLPVYRLPYEKYNLTMDQMLQESLAPWREITGREPPNGTITARSDYLYNRFGPWRFNEIVGYIRLHVLGTQIRGEYFSAEKKRNLLGRQKVFTFRTLKLACEVEIGPPFPATNDQIWKAIIKYIDRCRTELTKGRVIDDQLFVSIGRHIDWLTLLEWKSN